MSSPAILSVKQTARGRPAFADTQRKIILDLLRKAGADGVSRAHLIFNCHFTQCGARIDELRRMGCAIHSESRKGENYVRYVLDSEPLELKPLQEGEDWYEAQFGPRPSGKPQEKSEDDLPLFEGMR